VTYVPPVVRHLADRLDGLGWVTDLLVAGSLAAGDYVPGVSDIDLVALTSGPVGRARRRSCRLIPRRNHSSFRTSMSTPPPN